jgi:NADPH:quinone reductase-like Zn-dependent oxidoreductase
MKRLRFDTYGPPEVLRIEEVDTPGPGTGEVLIQIKATAINPSDVKNVAGHFNTALPRVPGRDFAGIVVTVGATDGAGAAPAGAARQVSAGVEVWGSGPGFGVVRDGAHGEYVVMPAEWVSAKPASLSMEQAASVGVPYVTAWSALVRTGAVQAGETVLVVGVSGAVGRAATQIAHWKGARVIGASTSTRNPSGADAVISTVDTELDHEVRLLTDGKGVDLVLDAVGGTLFEPALRSLRPGGRQVAITSFGERKVSFDLIDFYRNRSRLLGVNTMALSGPETAEILEELRPGFDGGRLAPPDLTTWPLEQAVEAYVASTHSGSRAKHILVP